MGVAVKKLVLLSTGGTIASVAGEQGRSVAGALPGEALLDQLQMGDGYQVEVHSVFQKPSNAITPADLLTLHNACQDMMRRPDVHGIVITHGTDTLEDTAYFLAATLGAPDCPVVVTGSQRTPHAVGTDAFVNLRQAFVLAGSSAARALGVLVLFNESIYSAHHVRKLSSFQLNGFGAPGYGRLGFVDDDQVHIHLRPVIPAPISVSGVLPRVDIHSAFLGAPADLIAASVALGARGLVIEGVGRGNVPPDWMVQVSAAIAAGVVVVVCTSCLHGPVHPSYEYDGSLHQLEQAGAIAMADLPARKARLRLMACLSGQTADQTLQGLVVGHAAQIT